MSKKVISIETGIWWTKVAVVDTDKKSPHVYDAFRFRTPQHAIEDGYIRDKESLARCLKEELFKHEIKENNVLFSINSSKVITREITIPYVKDTQLESVVEMQAREHFPMDVSNYTISFRKMEEIKGEEGRQLKLMLVAIPDNLLSNYCAFADMADFVIDQFEYIGNSAVSFINRFFPEDGVIVQIEEQATIISMVSNKKLVFQRITPYGFGTSLASVIQHNVLGINDQYEAFEFLKTHDVLHGTPAANEFPNSGVEDIELRKQLLEEAYADIREALSYHVRVVHTALEYYKNQTQGDFHGRLHLIGDGVSFAGMRLMFTSQIPLEVERVDYYTRMRHKKLQLSGDESLTVNSESYLSVIGATVHPLKIVPKEMREVETKKNSLQSAYLIFTCSVLLSVILILIGTIRQFSAVSEQKKLEEKIAQLSYIEAIYDEYEVAAAREQQFTNFDNLTHTENEKLAELLEALENELPNSMTIKSINIEESSITLNVSCDQKVTAAQMLMNFYDIDFLGNVSIPSMAESEDESGNTHWQFSVIANYVTPVVETEAVELEVTEEAVESVQEGETENE